MARKIKNYKKKEKKVSKKEIDKNIDKGMITIYNVCGKEVYDQMNLLKLDSSMVIEETFYFINQAYRMSMMHKSSIINGDYNKLKYNVNLFLKKYYEKYIPSITMGAYSILFLINELISNYIKINNYKELFTDEEMMKKDKNYYNINTYKKIKKIFNLKQSCNVETLFINKWMLDFKHISELLKYDLSILDKYREKIYNEKKLKENVFKSIQEIELRNFYKNDFNDEIYEYEFLNKLFVYLLTLKEIINSKKMLEKMLVIKPLSKYKVLQDLKYLKKSVDELNLFFDKFLILVFTGEEIRIPSEIKKKIKELEINSAGGKIKRAI